MAERRYTINSFTVNLDLAGDPSGASTDATLSPRRLTSHASDLLDLLAEYDIHCTFFVSEGVVDGARDVIREIVARGHETSILAPRFNTPLDQLLHLREQISAARQRLEDLSGQNVAGIRMTPITSSWRSPSMLETLVQEGFEWSSSTVPKQTLSPLLLSRTKRAHRLATPSGVLWELPLTAWRPFGIGTPSIDTSGGPRFAQLPAWMIARGVEGMNRHGEPALLWLECIDAAVRSSVDMETSSTPFTRGPVSSKLRAIFELYRFGSIREAFASRLMTTASVTPRGRTSIVRMGP